MSKPEIIALLKTGSFCVALTSYQKALTLVFSSDKSIKEIGIKWKSI